MGSVNNCSFCCVRAMDQKSSAKVFSKVLVLPFVLNGELLFDPVDLSVTLTMTWIPTVATSINTVVTQTEQ